MPRAVPPAAAAAAAAVCAVVVMVWHPAPGIALSKEMMPLPQLGDGGEGHDAEHRCVRVAIHVHDVLLSLLCFSGRHVEEDLSRLALWRLALVWHVRRRSCAH